MSQHRRSFPPDHVIHVTGKIQSNGTLIPYRPGCGAHRRTEYLVQADGLTVDEYKAKFVKTGKTYPSTLANCAREGVVELRPAAPLLPIVYDSNGRQRGGATFSCPKCYGITRVRRTSKLKAADEVILRSRQCTACDHLFSTQETLEEIFSTSPDEN
jgi:DNA-directed RNA polymerase subunit M/transcription elongation factor TFIIS